MSELRSSPLLEAVDMASIKDPGIINIRIFGALRIYMDKQGRPYAFEIEIPRKGQPAFDIARELHIPPEKIEAVFCNGRVINIYDSVLPGDRVAFLPYGTPGPYRVFLGMARENIERARIQKERNHPEVETGKEISDAG